MILSILSCAICHLHIFISKVWIQIFCPFFIGLFSHWVLRVLCIFCIHVLDQICFCKYFCVYFMYCLFIFFFFLIYCYLFIFGCIGSLLLCAGFLQLWRAGVAQQLWRRGLAAPQHVGSSRARARTRVPRIGRQILNHCTTREVPHFLNSVFQRAEDLIFD